VSDIASVAKGPLYAGAYGAGCGFGDYPRHNAKWLHAAAGDDDTAAARVPMLGHVADVRIRSFPTSR
jgi:hypothetical protein